MRIKRHFIAFALLYTDALTDVSIWGAPPIQ
jgi:hypothetical protein